MKIKCLAVPPYGTNCYVLEDGGQAAVIDPGGAAAKLLEAVKDLEVRCILLTHGHYDHTGAVAELAEALPEAVIYIHRNDYPDAPSRLFPLSGQVLAGECRAPVFYDEGDTLTLGERTITVLHTPGHSEGSVTLRCGDVLFCGDTLFAGSCGRTDFEGGSVEKILASLKRLGELEGDLQVLPGHMDFSTLDQERQSNPYLRRALRGEGL